MPIKLSHICLCKCITRIYRNCITITKTNTSSAWAYFMGCTSTLSNLIHKEPTHVWSQIYHHNTSFTSSGYPAQLNYPRPKVRAWLRAYAINRKANKMLAKCLRWTIIGFSIDLAIEIDETNLIRVSMCVICMIYTTVRCKSLTIWDKAKVRYDGTSVYRTCILYIYIYISQYPPSFRYYVSCAYDNHNVESNLYTNCTCVDSA